MSNNLLSPRTMSHMAVINWNEFNRVCNAAARAGMAASIRQNQTIFDRLMSNFQADPYELNRWADDGGPDHGPHPYVGTNLRIRLPAGYAEK